MLRILLVLAVTLIPACVPGVGPDANPFAGCYDHSCVDAPQRVPGLPPLAMVTSGISHSCALAADGVAWCWGGNNVGQLGDGSAVPREGPVKVAGEHRFSDISVGFGFTCAIDMAGTAWCWGVGGALGTMPPEMCGSSQCATSPQPLGGHTYVAIASGMRHSCAIDVDGVARCWGFNYRGETGSPALGTSTATPRAVTSSVKFVSVTAGDSYTCALTAEGKAWCWGSGDRGELGRRAPVCTSVSVFESRCTPTPGPVETTATFRMMSSGNSHTCALTATGAAHCWGDNGQFQLGANKPPLQDAPVVAHSGRTFTTIDASSAVTCATPPAGASVCWGLNLFGKLGVGSRIELSSTPLANQPNLRFTQIAGGSYHVCALVADGAAYCWGSGRDGQLGTGVLRP